MTDHSLPKDRAGKIWERSTDRSPILGLALKRKAAFNANTLCRLSLPYTFLTYWLISVKCQSWRFQTDWIYMRFIKMGARQKRKACLQQHWGKGHNASTNLIRQQKIHKGHVLSTGNLRAHTMLDFREPCCKRKWEETSFTSLAAGFNQGSAAWVCFARQSPGSFRNPTYSCGISLYQLPGRAGEPSECLQQWEEHMDYCTSGRKPLRAWAGYTNTLMPLPQVGTRPDPNQQPTPQDPDVHIETGSDPMLALGQLSWLRDIYSKGQSSVNPPVLPVHSRPCFPPGAPCSFWKQLSSALGF